MMASWRLFFEASLRQVVDMNWQHLEIAAEKAMAPHLQYSCLENPTDGCPTLCDPTDGGPPGSPIPRILQARTLEWVAISFSNAPGRAGARRGGGACVWGEGWGSDFIFLGSKITADGDCSHEIKRCLLLGRKVMTSLAPHERLPEILVVPREKTPTGAAARGNP